MPFFFSLPSLEATERLAQKLAPLLNSGDTLALYGSLGAGKTVFARALIHALGGEGEIPSPTFTLVQNYDTPTLTVAHFDLYRLKSANELEELGWDDALATSLVLVEWPERAGSLLPSGCLALHFTINPDHSRTLLLESSSDWKQRLETLQ